jgi:DNA-binding transcriptional LysR family regulator
MNTKLPLLDLALLQTLVAVHETGTLTRAAEAVGRTQSAVSLQLRRLEEMLDVELFDRSGRAMVLTESGEVMLLHAHRMLELNGDAVTSVRGHHVAGLVSLGISVDFEHTWLPRAMARFASLHPKIVVNLRVDRNSALERAVGSGEIDIALVFGSEAKADDSIVGSVPMAWIASQDFKPPSELAMPLLLLEPPCMFRSAALEALERAKIPWRVAVTSPSLGGLWATALASMGLTVRGDLVLPPGLSNVGARLKLPQLPTATIRLLESKGRATPPRVTLRRVLRDLAEEFFVEPRVH